MDAPQAAILEKDAIEEAAGNAAQIEQYRELASAVGFEPTVLTLYRLRAYLRAGGLRVYPLEDVEAYMDEKCGAPRLQGPWANCRWLHSWGWFPLRSADRVQSLFVGRTYEITRDEHYKSAPCSYIPTETITERRTLRSDLYAKLVPFAPLRTVHEIAVAFPSLRFSVADRQAYEVLAVRPENEFRDPFLAVFGDGIPFMVIERWDEPGFR